MQVGGVAPSNLSRYVARVRMGLTVLCVQIRGQFIGPQHDGIALCFAGKSSDDNTIEYDNGLSAFLPN